jgi:hypothetical protein
MGRNSIVGVATRWTFRRSNPNESASSALVQTGPGSFQPPAEVKERVQLNLTSPSVLHVSLYSDIYFYLQCVKELPAGDFASY